MQHDDDRFVKERSGVGGSYV